MEKSQSLSRFQKVLLALLDLSESTRRNIRFEDIVVKLFKDYPEEFHLRGYKEYPDSGDMVHKPLYDAKKKGLVTAGNKIFTLTDRGISIATQIKDVVAGKHIRSDNRLSRHAEKEVARILSLDGFQGLFINDEREKILDTDFYNYLGVTVRTSKNDFMGRSETMKSVVKELESLKSDEKKPLYDKIIQYHNFLFDKFGEIITYKSLK